MHIGLSIVYIIWGILVLLAFVFSTEWGDYSSPRSILHKGKDILNQKRWRKNTATVLLISLFPLIGTIIFTSKSFFAIELYAGQIILCSTGFMISRFHPAKKKPPYLRPKKE